jgi:hypothetical protein
MRFIDKNGNYAKMINNFSDKETNRYHVQVLIPTGTCNPKNEWVFVRPCMNADPYVFSNKDANDYIRLKSAQTGKPQNYRLYKLAAIEAATPA